MYCYCHYENIQAVKISKSETLDTEKAHNVLYIFSKFVVIIISIADSDVITKKKNVQFQYHTQSLLS